MNTMNSTCLKNSEHFSDSSGLNLPDRAVPLYEAKLIHQFDHRYANYEPSHDEYKETSLDRKADPTFRISTRYYVPRKAFHKYVERHHLKQDWFISYRKVTNATNERTVIFAATPFYAAGESMHRVSLFAAEEKADLQALFICNCNSFVLDYLARQKLGGPNLAKYVLEQLPILPPDRYSPRLVEFAIPRALELVFTAWDIKPFADDVWTEADPDLKMAITSQWEVNVAETGGHVGSKPPAWLELVADVSISSGFPKPPFKWDEERRAQLRAELDALYGHLYGLTRDEFDYILETFPIVHRKDEEKYGEYRAKRLILEYFDQLAEEDWVREARPRV